jgi:hypothetical protein
VSATGLDTNNGSVAAPFLTLEKAYARAAKSISRKTVAVASDISLTAAVTLSAAAVAGGQVGIVTITSDSTVRKLARTDSGNDSVIKVSGGAKVVFQNITIDGKTTGSNRALAVSGAGTEVTLETGATLTGKLTNGTSGKGGGVSVASGSAFTIRDGGKVINSEASDFGGGVSVDGGTFNLADGGVVSGNNAVRGGGVNVQQTGALFNMDGGVISGNTATQPGGGVIVNGGTFTMTGGTIGASNNGTYGGGVFASAGLFTMNGGVISGNTATTNGGGVGIDNSGNFVINIGVIYGSNAVAELKNTVLGGNSTSAVYKGSGGTSNQATIDTTVTKP